MLEFPRYSPSRKSLRESIRNSETSPSNYSHKLLSIDIDAWNLTFLRIYRDFFPFSIVSNTKRQLTGLHFYLRGLFCTSKITSRHYFPLTSCMKHVHPRKHSNIVCNNSWAWIQIIILKRKKISTMRMKDSFHSSWAKFQRRNLIYLWFI